MAPTATSKCTAKSSNNILEAYQILAFKASSLSAKPEPAKPRLQVDHDWSSALWYQFQNLAVKRLANPS
jgi:hypothetical protein